MKNPAQSGGDGVEERCAVEGIAWVLTEDLEFGRSVSFGYKVESI